MENLIDKRTTARKILLFKLRNSTFVSAHTYNTPELNKDNNQGNIRQDIPLNKTVGGKLFQ